MRNEILAYFEERITNGRTEGFNNRAKRVKKRAYGYRSFNNYRLALLKSCATWGFWEDPLRSDKNRTQELPYGKLVGAT